MNGHFWVYNIYVPTFSISSQESFAQNPVSAWDWVRCVLFNRGHYSVLFLHSKKEKDKESLVHLKGKYVVVLTLYCYSVSCNTLWNRCAGDTGWEHGFTQLGHESWIPEPHGPGTSALFTGQNHHPSCISPMNFVEQKYQGPCDSPCTSHGFQSFHPS